MAEDLKLKKLEIVTVRVPHGTSACIARRLKGGELRSVFIREAIRAEIERRGGSDPRKVRK